MDSLSLVFEKLISDQSIATSGFCIGFLYYVKPFNKKTLDEPLSYIANGVIEGSLCSFGALLISNFMPPPVKIVIPIISCVACIYYQLKK